MTLELLIHSIVRQTTLLIAKLATSGGARAPLAQVADQVFLDLVRELEREGVSRRVSADMFGLGLRTGESRLIFSRRERAPARSTAPPRRRICAPCGRCGRTTASTRWFGL